MAVFTIGHSNHTIEAFVDLLRIHHVTALVDVRSHPYSRYLPHFNKSPLRETLEPQGVRYVFLGQELGARPNHPACYVDGKAVYEKIAQTEAFAQGIHRILDGSAKYRIALMCAEKDPLTCHRAILVCQHLKPFGIEINHILSNGDLETHHHLEDRMLMKHGFHDCLEMATPTQLSLFVTSIPTREDCLTHAYRLQGDEIAYVEKQDSTDAD